MHSTTFIQLAKTKEALTPKEDLEQNLELDQETEVEPNPQNIMTDEELIKFRKTLTKVRRMTYNLSLFCQ